MGREAGWIAILNGVVQEDLFEKVTFDQDLKKVRESKEKHSRQKEQVVQRPRDGASLAPWSNTINVLKNQCQESRLWVIPVSAFAVNGDFPTLLWPV